MSTDSSNSTSVKVDDTNPALIYSGGWFTIASDSGNEYNNTSHGTRTEGSSVQFTFNGTFVAVYGIVGLDTPISSYDLDGTTSVYAAGKVDVPVHQQLFFQSSGLNNGEHTLRVTDIGSGALWIDYLVYAPSLLSSTPSSLSPSATPSLSSVLTSRTVISTPSQPPDVDTLTPSSTGLPGPANSNSKSSIPVPAVAGGAIGALVLIVALVFGVLYYRKRAERLAGARLLAKENILEDSSELDKTDPGAVITPFTRAYTSGSHPSSGYGGSNTNMYPPGPAYPRSDYDNQHRRHPSTPIYHFSNNSALQSGYNPSSDNIAGAGAGLRYGRMDHGGTHLDYPNTSSDRLAAPQRQNSIEESAESHTSLAYISSDRTTIDPLSPFPGASSGHPPSQVTRRQTGKDGFIIQNDNTPQLRQHEDGGVRLNVRPQDSSPQQQIIDLPPVYKPNY